MRYLISMKGAVCAVAVVALSFTVALSPAAGVDRVAAEEGAKEANTSELSPTFTYAAVMAELQDQQELSSRAPGVEGASSRAEEYEIAAIEINGQHAVVNHSLADSAGSGVISAATPSYVDIAWQPLRNVDSYVIVRDGQVVKRTHANAVRFSNVVPGERIEFKLTGTPLDEGAEFVPVYGLTVVVPKKAGSEVHAVEAEFDRLVEEAAGYTSSRVNWNTFIPEDKVAVPPVRIRGMAGCDFPYGFEFGGDNRDFSPLSNLDNPWSTRTRLTGTLTWADPIGNRVREQFAVANSVVYLNGEWVAYGNAQDISTAEVTEMPGFGGPSETTLRVAQQSPHPFCWGNSIEGAFQLELNREGNWAIRSGSHRQMPHHQIWMNAWGIDPPAAGHATEIYRRSYASPLCLVYWACATASMSGFVGEY